MGVTKAFVIRIPKDDAILKLNNIMKQNRLEQGLTQEQLAKRLGVSTPAVNKWEKGVSYPDITMLPPLARVLKVDLNTLLSFREDLSDGEIYGFIGDTFANLNKENYDEIFQLCMDKIHEFPTCDKLIFHIIMSLSGGLYILDMEHKEAYEEKLSAYHYQCASSDDIQVKNQAIAFLVGKSMEHKKYETAQMYVDMLPTPSLMCNKQQYQGGLYVAMEQYDKALEVLEGNLFRLTTEIYTALNSMMGIALKENRVEDATFLVRVIEQTTKTYGLWDYYANSAYYDLYLHKKEENKLLDTIDKLLSSFAHTDKLPTSKLYGHMQQKEISPNTHGQFGKGILEMLKADADGSLAFVKENPRFMELIEKYSEH